MIWGKICFFSTLSVFVTVSPDVMTEKKNQNLDFYFPFVCPISLPILCFQLWKQMVKTNGDKIWRKLTRKGMLKLFSYLFTGWGGLFAFGRGRWLLMAKHYLKRNFKMLLQKYILHINLCKTKPIDWKYIPQFKVELASLCLLKNTVLFCTPTSKTNYVSFSYVAYHVVLATDVKAFCPHFFTFLFTFLKYKLFYVNASLKLSKCFFSLKIFPDLLIKGR